MRNLSTKALVFALALILALALGGAYLAFRVSSTPPAEGTVALYTGPIGPYATLVGTNPDYAGAGQDLRAGRYKDALQKLHAALGVATTDAERAQIRFDIANATNLDGEPMRAIQLYKQIFADQNNSPILRAYTIEYMGRIFYSRRDPKVTAEIFKDEPFATLRVSGNDGLSYRNLFEHASSIFPLALNDLYIAQSYATALVGNPARIGTEDGTREIELIRAKIAHADAEILRMSVSSSNEVKLVPEVLLMKASVLETMRGIDPTVVDANIETVYRQALNTYAALSQINGADYYMRLFYAIFLAKTGGAERLPDIRDILQGVYQDEGSAAALHAQFLINSARPGSYHRENLITLAQIDNDFKAVLLLHGWHETDF